MLYHVKSWVGMIELSRKMFFPIVYPAPVNGANDREQPVNLP